MAARQPSPMPCSTHSRRSASPSWTCRTPLPACGRPCRKRNSSAALRLFQGWHAIVLSMRSLRLIAALAAVLVLAVLSPALTLAQQQDPRVFPETGYTIADDAVWSYFTSHGGTQTFGAPISRELTLLDS